MLSKRPLPLACLVLSACTMAPEPETVTSRSFGLRRDGLPATLWTLRRDDVTVQVTDHGATLVSLTIPDRRGRLADVVLGFDDVAGYESDQNQYFGCTTGRVCNRIRKGRFTLDGYDFQLAINNGENHLHGGVHKSLDKVRWRGRAVRHDDTPAVEFTYRSRDGEENYPGNLELKVTYTLLPRQLRIDCEATTDARTPVNVTNHAYWNLAGHGAPTILDHELQIEAEHYTPTDATLIPTGSLATVAATPLDFRRSTPIGLRIESLTATPARGYDHNYALKRAGDGLQPAATLWHPASGRVLKIATTEPGLQFYSGNFLAGQRGKGGAVYAHRSALCLETQHFPDSVNQPAFPSTILEPGAVYQTTTILSFLVR
jgi:aldose 1-epimerase